jgi:hypothetical protein
VSQIAGDFQSPCAHAEPYWGGHWSAGSHFEIATPTASSGGQGDGAAQLRHAAGEIDFGAGQKSSADLVASASAEVIAEIIETWRQRMDLLRARQRIELQAQAICRRVLSSDDDNQDREKQKAKAAKLWASVKSDPAHPLRTWLTPYLMGIAPFDVAKADAERDLCKLVRKIPIHAWAKTILGLGEVSLAGIIGEAGGKDGIGPGDYKSVSALWKRMGLAVISGGRQRRVTGADALDHGYCAERRSHMWNIGACIIKAQIRSEKDDDGKKIAGSEYSRGELGGVYLARKAYLNERNAGRESPMTPMHIHNDAARYMTKRLLRQLWQEWRRAIGALEAMPKLPAATHSELTQ